MRGAERLRRVALGLWLAGLGSACGHATVEEPAPRLRGIVLVLLDTVRADRLSAYGYERDTTPALAALAARGALFEHVQSSAPWTVPSVASLWTGLHPTVHGAGLEGEPRTFDPYAIRVFDGSLATLPQHLHALGYRTYARIANDLLGSACFLAGFDEVAVARARGEELVEWVEQRLPELAAQPFFLYLHFMDAHVPLEPSAERVRAFLPTDFAPEALAPVVRDASRWGKFKKVENLKGPRLAEFRVLKQATYDASLRYLDEQLARLLASLERAGLARDTLVVVTADHGEEFWDHLELEHATYDADSKVALGTGHGHALFEELLHVPLVLAGPGVPAGTRIATRVQLLDLGATVLELAAGAGAPRLGDGQSLVTLVAGARAPDRVAYSEGLAHGYEQRTLVDGEGFKLIRATGGGERDLLFDLRADPGETRDLLAREPERAARLRSQLEQLQRALAARRAAQGPKLEGPDIERLRELGYVGGAEGDDSER